MPRDNSNKLLTRITGKRPEHRRNLRARNRNTLYEMDRLTLYDQQKEGQGDREEDAETETDCNREAGLSTDSNRSNIGNKNSDVACSYNSSYRNLTNSIRDSDRDANARDDRMLEGCDEEMSTEQNEMQYSLFTSSSNHNVVDNLINIDLMHVCYDTNVIASDREGIG